MTSVYLDDEGRAFSSYVDDCGGRSADSRPCGRFRPRLTALHTPDNTFGVKYKQLVEELESLKTERDAKIKELQHKEAEINKAREELAKVEKELSNVEKQLIEARKDVEAKTAEIERLAREAQTLASERDKLREQIAGLEAEASNLKKEITSLNSLLETFRRRVSELETIASPLVNGTWREITRFERSGRGWTQISNNRFPNAYVDAVTIPESLAIRLKITRLSGGQAVFWWLSKPRDNDNYYSTVIAKDNAVDVISVAILGATTGSEEMLLYNTEPGNYDIITHSAPGIGYEVVVEAFIPH